MYGCGVSGCLSCSIPLLARLSITPQVVGWTRASGTTGGKGEVPSLAKEGTAAPSSKRPRSFGGAARSVSPVGRNIKNGVVRSTSDNRWLEPTTPSTPAKEASRHFLNGRSHPSLSKERTSAFASVSRGCSCPQFRNSQFAIRNFLMTLFAFPERLAARPLPPAFYPSLQSVPPSLEHRHPLAMPSAPTRGKPSGACRNSCPEFSTR